MWIWALRAYVLLAPIVFREEFLPALSSRGVPPWKIAGACAAALAASVLAVHEYRVLRARLRSSPGDDRRQPWLSFVIGNVFAAPASFVFFLWDMSVLAIVVALPYASLAVVTMQRAADRWRRGRSFG